MQPSSSLCRTQERYHLDQAAKSVLPNLREQATGAAAAWAREAEAAERRDKRRAAAAGPAEGRIALPVPASDTMPENENPDRSFAHA
ncbi:hypothetical protein [Sphingosinicella microcystinivorans]|uniref:hypothetical protein n=1 Tax=Sphingosinicella microcystinivorans TaxID=335406 RepID=UPI0022F3E283|nr:hypothetical protein [Sphingosinicella microcystinivorans]WBX84574.1 hypothetical protein PE061_01185 [Sphingosinicella microcystinivorans]